MTKLHRLLCIYVSHQNFLVRFTQLIGPCVSDRDEILEKYIKTGKFDVKLILT